ncbi:MAG: hypothetical protein ACYDER_24650 [Ktedonobacteraceae bacterium]
MTIGSLVQETSARVRWITTICLYTLACLGTSSLLGGALGSGGLLLHRKSCTATFCPPVFTGGSLLVGILAIAYAISDVGLIRLPRPTVMDAVPVTWWRWWRPYGAALAYGAALGLGVTTRIEFGSFYILCMWCILKGNPFYGLLLMGTYGLVRALVVLPLSCFVYRKGCDSRMVFAKLFEFLGETKIIVAVALIFFGTTLLVSTIFQSFLSSSL